MTNATVYSLYLQSLSPTTRICVAVALGAIARFLGYSMAEQCPWHELGHDDVQRVRNWLAADFHPGTARRYLSNLRSVMRECFRSGRISHEAYARAINVPRIPGSRVAKGRSLENAELRALFEVCPSLRGVQGARDAALIALLYGAGLRRSEVVALNVDCFRDDHVRVVGKGNKERDVHVPEGTRAAIEHWISIRGPAPGPLFVPLTWGGSIRRKEPLARLSEGSVPTIVVALAQRAGLARLTAHDFRRTYVGDLLDAGVDLSTVQKLAGHSSPTTTALYDRRGTRGRAQAARLLHVPFELARTRPHARQDDRQKES